MAFKATSRTMLNLPLASKFQLFFRFLRRAVFYIVIIQEQKAAASERSGLCVVRATIRDSLAPHMLDPDRIPNSAQEVLFPGCFRAVLCY
jgi:hypothetical protein